MTDLSEATANREAIKSIKRQYDSGLISRERAKELAQPIINRVNERALLVAKRHNKKPYKLSFTSLMRDSY